MLGKVGKKNRVSYIGSRTNFFGMGWGRRRCALRRREGCRPQCVLRALPQHGQEGKQPVPWEGCGLGTPWGWICTKSPTSANGSVK